MIDLKLKLRAKEITRLLIIFILFSLLLLGGSFAAVSIMLNINMKKSMAESVKSTEEISQKIFGSSDARPALISGLRASMKNMLKIQGVNTVEIKDVLGKTLISESHTSLKKMALDRIFSFKYPIKHKDQTLASLIVLYDYGHALKDHFSITSLITLAAFNLIALVFAILIYVDIKLLQPLRVAAGNIDKLLDWDSRKTNDDSSLKKIKRFQGKTTEIVEMISETQEILNMLFDISRVFTSNLDISEIFDSVLEIIRSRFDSISVAILEMSEDGYLKVKNHRGLSREFVRTSRIKAGEGLVGKVYENTKACIINDVYKQGDPYTQDMSEQEHIKSVFYVPLVLEHHPMGVLMVVSKNKGYFDFKKVKTLTMIAESTSIAMKNSRLYEQLQSFNRRLEAEVSSTTQELTQTNTRLIKKVRELKALYDIAFATSKKMDLEDVLTVIMERVQEIMNVEFISFALYNEKNNELDIKKLMIRGEFLEGRESSIRMIDSGIYTRVYKTGETYISNKMFREDQKNLGIPSDYSLRSILCVPLKTKFKTTGLFCFGNKIDSPFNDDDIRLVTVLCNQTAEVIENIKLYQENKRRVQDLTTLQEISISVSAIVSMPDVLEKASSIIVRELEADMVAFMLYNEPTRELVIQQGSYFPGKKEFSWAISLEKRKSVCVNAFKMGEPIWMGDYNVPDEQKEEYEKDLRSVIVVPLKVENKTIGILYIGSSKDKFFEFEHLRLSSLVGDHVALIIEKAKLYEKLGNAVKELKNMDDIKNQFIVSVSNELKVPLEALEGFFKVINSGEAGQLKPQQKHFMELADQSIKRLRSLIDDLVDISSIENGLLKLDKKPCYIPDILKNAVEDLKHMFVVKNQKINIVIGENIKKVEADYEWMTQALEHIISNAIKFSPNNSIIEASVQNSNGDVRISVQDSGIGIPKNEQNNVFAKFYQIDKPEHKELRGSGLGLSIVKSIVDLHNGHIELISEENKGSEFIVTFPPVLE